MMPRGVKWLLPAFHAQKSTAPDIERSANLLASESGIGVEYPDVRNALVVMLPAIESGWTIKNLAPSPPLPGSAYTSVNLRAWTITSMVSFGTFLFISSVCNLFDALVEYGTSTT